MSAQSLNRNPGLPRLGALELGCVPRIAVSVSDRTPAHIMDRLPRSGADIAEARVDLYESTDPTHLAEHLGRLRGMARLGTIRTADEGGRWQGDEAQRLALFRALMPHVDGIDVELAAASVRDLLAEARGAGKLAIVSHHDFEGTPTLQALRHLVRRGFEHGADAVKLATTVTSDEELRRLAQLLLEQPRPRLVVVGMGRLGEQSRVLLPALGSLFTFAFAGTPTAAGQLPFDEMFALLRRLYPDYAAAKPGSYESLA